MMRVSRTGIRFLIAGGLNTLVGWLIYSVSILMGAPVWLALIISTVLGVGFNFLTIGGYAFRALSAHRFPKFISAYGLVYVINILLINGLTNWINSAIWAQLLLTPPMALLSFLLMSRWVFADNHPPHNPS